MPDRPIGLLWDSVSYNIGDQAIGMVMRRFCERRGIAADVLDPFTYDPSGYSSIVIGGGQLIRRKGNPFYDCFRVQGAHILNAVGLHEPDELEYLKEYRLVAVRSEAERGLLESVVPEVKVCPCVAMVFGDLFDTSTISLPTGMSVPSGAIGVHVTMPTFRNLPDLLPVLQELDRTHKVLLLPFTFYQNDDAIMEVLSRWMPNACISSARDPLTVFKSIGQLSALVCSSLHASMFAYVQNVPVLAYPTDPKIRNFWHERQYPSCVYEDPAGLLAGLERHLSDPPDFATSAERDKALVHAHLDEVASLVQHPIAAHPASRQSEAQGKAGAIYYNWVLEFLFALGRDYAAQVDLRLQLAAEEREMQALSAASVEAQDRLIEIQRTLETLKAQIAEIERSKAWRLVLVLRRLRLWLIPIGSVREQIAMEVWHLLRPEQRHSL